MLITQNTFLKLIGGPSFAIRNIGRVRVKGKADLVTIHEVFEADKPEVKEGKLMTLPKFLEGLYNYSVGKQKEAAQLFSECLQQNPLDQVAQNYVDRCQEMQVRLPLGRSEFV